MDTNYLQQFIDNQTHIIELLQLNLYANSNKSYNNSTLNNKLREKLNMYNTIENLKSTYPKLTNEIYKLLNLNISSIYITLTLQMISNFNISKQKKIFSYILNFLNDGLSFNESLYKLSREYYIREIAKRNYDPTLSDLENWLKAEKEFDYPDLDKPLNRLGYDYSRECDRIIIHGCLPYCNKTKDGSDCMSFGLYGVAYFKVGQSEDINTILEIQYENNELYALPLDCFGYKLDGIIKFLKSKNIKFNNECNDIVESFLKYKFEK